MSQLFGIQHQVRDCYDRLRKINVFGVDTIIEVGAHVLVVLVCQAEDSKLYLLHEPCRIFFGLPLLCHLHATKSVLCCSLLASCCYISIWKSSLTSCHACV